MENPLAAYDHPAWVTAVATLLGYGAILTALFVLVFVLPFLIFSAL
jgi:hypothetical protein